MRTATIELYQFNELSDAAKERAREWYRNGLEYPWWDESMDSVKAFCKHFEVKVRDYEIGAWGYRPNYISTDEENGNFRGRRLRDFDRDAMPTGFYLDCTLWQTFYDCFKDTGSAKLAFEAAINEVVDVIAKDVEYQYSDESVDEMLTINEYEFTEDGRIH